tara:strand:- start:3683 stop:4858 length:1176 start_codon:yes stop_codon:yes gene_type:complete
MLNQEVNPLSILAKRPYTSSGWRVLKSRPTGGSGSSFGLGTTAVAANTADLSTPRSDQIGGVEENATLDGANGFRPLSPEYAKLYVSPKTVAHLFEFSELGMELAAIDDGVGDIRAIIREDMGKHHAETQSRMLVMPFENYDDGTATDIERNYTSLLKIVSSAGEVAAMYNANLLNTGANNGDNSAVVADVKNIFGTSRTVTISSNAATGTASYLDAEVDFGDGYAAADARVLTLSMLNSMIRRIRQNGGNPKCILTGYDTIQHIADLLQSQERFMDRKEIVPTHNGVKGVKGTEAGFRVATYFDIPLIPAKDMGSTGANTTNTLSDMLFLDTDHMWLSVMKPTQYFEDGITNGNPFGVGKLGNQGMYRTMGETCCSFFKGQGKITNIKSA